jgi:hypothetical protein
MSIKVTVVADDVQKQAALLAQTDRILDRHFYQAMIKSVDLTHDLISPNIPRRTGEAAGSFRKGVFGFGRTLAGAVGWFGDLAKKTWYVNIVNSGARQHSLVKNSKNRSQGAQDRLAKRAERGTLRSAQVNINGRWVTMRIHPGFSKRDFMGSGFRAAQPIVNAEMKIAADAALAEQVVR